MKIKMGIRKPTLSKSLGMGFQGQLTRSLFRSIDKSYGKKNFGMIKHPKKAMYNEVYSKGTFGGFSSLKKDGVIGTFIKCCYKVGIFK